MTLDPIRTDPRRGGAVERYHTWPTIQRQCVAAHTWNVVRLLLTLWPDAPQPAVVYAQFHDVGEVGTGDVPYPVKHNNPVLAEVMDRLEHETMCGMGIPIPAMPPEQGAHWKTRIKLCDVLEMWEFGLDEMALGNMFGQRVAERMEEMTVQLANQHLDEDERVRVMEYRIWRITKQP